MSVSEGIDTFLLDYWIGKVGLLEGRGMCVVDGRRIGRVCRVWCDVSW